MRASPTHGGHWLGQTNFDALMTHHTTEDTPPGCWERYTDRYDQYMEAIVPMTKEGPGQCLQLNYLSLDDDTNQRLQVLLYSFNMVGVAVDLLNSTFHEKDLHRFAQCTDIWVKLSHSHILQSQGQKCEIIINNGFLDYLKHRK